MWLPETADELAAALTAGTLTESHFSDFKREFGAGGSANSGMAVDLASFAVDGGVIYIGVDEDTSPATVTPFPLAGVAERVQQIARNGAIDPPVDVVTRELETSPGEGVLLVIIPPSASAPHQVAGKYRGRAGVINTALSDAEVRRVLASRATDRDAAGSGLDALFASDPLGSLEAPLPRLFVSALPSVRRAGLLLNAVPDRDIRRWITTRLLNNNGPLVRTLEPRFGMDFAGGINTVRRAEGWAVVIGNAGAEHSVGTSSFVGKGALDLEVSEDGDVGLYCSDISWRKERTVVWDETVNGLVLRALMVAGAVSTTTRYLGEWDLGVQLVDLKGTVSGSEHSKGSMMLVPYSNDMYRQTATTSAVQLTDDPERVVRLLMGRFNRAFSGERVAVPRPIA